MVQTERKCELCNLEGTEPAFEKMVINNIDYWYCEDCWDERNTEDF